MMITASAMCLATAIFFEARGETFSSKEAVAAVILNRVDHDYYPDDVCSVVNQECQFSYNCDGLSDDPTRFTEPSDVEAWYECLMLANLLDDDPSMRLGITSTHFHTIGSSPYWKDIFPLDFKSGNHLFYTETKR